MDDAELQAKADQKLDFVQKFIRNLESAFLRYEAEERAWLKKIIDPDDPCFRTLVSIVVTPKYAGFIALRCASLRAIQMILRIAVSTVTTTVWAVGANTGMKLLVELAGEQLARDAHSQICGLAECPDEDKALLSCDALLVLAELGPEALEPRLVHRSLGLFQTLPDRADELVEVALRVHAWGGKHRKTLLEAAVLHPGGPLLGEVLLQVVNRSDPVRTLRALKVLSGCLSRPSSENFLYTNDVRVLVEILIRELPSHVGDDASFTVHIDCFKALVTRCRAARDHRPEDAREVLRELSEDEQTSAAVRTKCAEVLSDLTHAANGP